MRARYELGKPSQFALRLLNIDQALASAGFTDVIATFDPQWPGIARYDQAQDSDTPLIPLTELSTEEWSRTGTSNTGWLQLFAGFAVLLWVTVVFGLIIARGGAAGANGWDGRVARWMADHRPAWVTTVAGLTSAAGSGAVLTIGVIVFGVVVWRHAHKSGPAAFALLAVADTQVVVQIAKRIVARPRPAIGLATAKFGGYAWPSGHSSSVAVAVSSSLVVAIIGCSAVVVRRTRLVAATFAIAIAIAASRVALGAHWLSDVLMGGIVGSTVAVLLAAPLLGHRPRHTGR